MRREQIAETRQMARRQARDAHAFQALLLAPVEAALLKLNTPTGQEELKNLPLGDLIALGLVASRAFPRVAAAERMARGAPVQDLTAFLDQETGLVTDGPTPRELYEWQREALAALDAATGGRLALPPGDPA